MPLLDDHGLCADPWRRVADDTPPPAAVGMPLLVSLERLRAEGESMLAEGRRLGVALDNIVDPGSLAIWQSRLGLIAINFPSFADGRGFSLARRLRVDGFKGELRAVGPLIADQFAFARACGFDTVEIDDALAARQPVEHWLSARHAIGLSYQRSYHGTRNVLDARRAALIDRDRLVEGQGRHRP
jgi:uncharacterized protein (DUF934 family)